MRKRPITKTSPDLEPLEERRPLSASGSTAPLGSKAGAHPTAAHPAETSGSPVAVPTGLITPAHTVSRGQRSISPKAVKPNHGFLVYRITNPTPFNAKLTPPFSGHVLVQSAEPVPGQVYNVLYVAVRNGTAQTFDASSGFRVKFPGQRNSFPILTGSEQWKPGQEFIFYVLTKKYYPPPQVVSSGFDFNLGGAYSAAIPGPSGIFLRLTYNPATINRVLDSIVAFGPGAEGGAGIKFGLPDTAIYEFVSAKTNRLDFGGYF
jgi:hypothetical protein